MEKILCSVLLLTALAGSTFGEEIVSFSQTRSNSVSTPEIRQKKKMLLNEITESGVFDVDSPQSGNSKLIQEFLQRIEDLSQESGETTKEFLYQKKGDEPEENESFNNKTTKPTDPDLAEIYEKLLLLNKKN